MSKQVTRLLNAVSNHVKFFKLDSAGGGDASEPGHLADRTAGGLESRPTSAGGGDPRELGRLADCAVQRTSGHAGDPDVRPASPVGHLADCTGILWHDADFKKR